MFFKKSQAAMEFLMTYGWAILVVLIVIGVFWQMGIFNTMFVPEKCVIGGGGYLNCQDWQITTNPDPAVSDSILLSVVNGQAKEIEVGRIDINSEALSATCYNSTAQSVLPGSKITLFVNHAADDSACKLKPTVAKSRYKYYLNITFRPADSEFNKTLTGELIASKEG